MGIEYREELVGKRFLCVVGNSKPKTPISEWPWRAGIIRAIDKTTPAVNGKDATVYVEFDGEDWHKREWLKINSKSHQVFLVEKTAVWAERVDPYAEVPNNITWPALSFKVLIDRCSFKDSPLKPVEFFFDKLLDFYKKTDIEIYKEALRKSTNKPIFKRYPDVKFEFDRWLHEQREQHILMKAPYGLSGYRVKVYRIGSTTQWFTAVITGHDLMTRDLIVMDDTVLESKTENPAHVHMMFLDDVVNSLLKGENVGITSRRRATAAVTANSTSQASSLSTYSRSMNSSHQPAPSMASYPVPQGTKKRKTTKGEGTNDTEGKERDKIVKAEKPSRVEKPATNKNKKERKRKPEENGREEGKSQPEVPKRTKPNAEVNSCTPVQDPQELTRGPQSPIEDPVVCTRDQSPPSTADRLQGPDRVLPEKDKCHGSDRNAESTLQKPVTIGAHPGSVPTTSVSSTAGPTVPQSTVNMSALDMTAGPKLTIPMSRKLPVCIGPDSTVDLRSESHTARPNISESKEIKVNISQSDTRAKNVANVEQLPATKARANSDTSKEQPAVTEAPVKATPDINRMGSLGGSDAGFLLKLSQAISANPSRRQPKTERDSPFTNAIAGIIARELSKDHDRPFKKVGQEGTPSMEQTSTSLSALPTSTVSTSVSMPNKLFNPMQNMLKAQVSAQEAVIPAVPSEAMVKNCLMKTATVTAKPAAPVSRSVPKVSVASSTPHTPHLNNRTHPLKSETDRIVPTTKVVKAPRPMPSKDVPNDRPQGVELDLRKEHVVLGRTDKLKKESREVHGIREASGRYEAAPAFKDGNHKGTTAGSGSKEPVKVFRDPNLKDNPVTHVRSIQHTFPHHLAKQDHHKQSTHLRTAAAAAAQSGALSGSPSAFIPSNLHSNALQTLLPPQLQLYPHHLGLPYNLIHATEGGYHPHMTELMVQQEALTRLRHQQALLQAAPTLTPAQLQALLQNQHHGIAIPPTMLVPHTQEELEMAHLRTQREQQKLHAEKLAQLETKAILHADKHLFSSSSHPLQPSRPQPTSSSGSAHSADMYRSSGEPHNNNHREPMVDVHAAIERHFQESLGKPHMAFTISPYNLTSGSITRGTPLPKTDHRTPPSDKDHQHKEQIEQERLRREREEKELEWQRLQREKEYKQNQIQKEMERKIMFPAAGMASDRERAQKIATSMDLKNDDKLFKHVFNQLTPKYSGLSPPDTKPDKRAIGDVTLQTSSGAGFQVYQPYKAATHKPSGLKYEEARPGIPIRTEHNRLKAAPSYMSAFQVKPHHLEGYVPFGHTVISGKKHEERTEGIARSHRGPAHSPHGRTHSPHASSHSPHGLSHSPRILSHSPHGASHSPLGTVEKDRKGIPNPPPLIKKEPGLQDQRVPHEFRESRTIQEVGAKSLWEKQIRSAGRADGTRSVPVIVRHNEPGKPLSHSQASSPLKVASPQQLSRAALQPMEVKSNKHSSQHSPKNCSPLPSASQSILMSALRPGEQQQRTTQESQERPDPAVKRKSPNQPVAVKRRAKDGAVMGVAEKDFGKAGAVTSFSVHCQSYQPTKEQGPFISGSGTIHAKVSENVELKIEKVDQLKRVTADAASPAIQRVSALTNAVSKNGSLSDNERSRSVSPRSMSDSSDSRKTSSPNRTHVKCKKAWIQRLSESTDSPPPQECRQETPLSNTLANGHLHSLNTACTTSEKHPAVTLSDIQKSIPGKVYDFDNMSTGSESSVTSGKPRQKRLRENKRTRKRTSSPLADNPQQNGMDHNSQVDEMGDHHKQVTASLIELMAKAPKKRIITRAHKDKEAFSVVRTLSKTALAKLKRSGEPFLQDGPCTNITPTLMKCRECRMKGNKQTRLNIFCRFYAFRRLRYSLKGNLTIAGFSEMDHYDREDLSPWLPSRLGEDPANDVELSKYIMQMTADKFCELVLKEQEAKKALPLVEGKVTWKRPVGGVREMCDTCDTTLFNIHWTCSKCGFVVCPDCLKAKKGDSTRSHKSPEMWLKCIKDQPHLPENLMLTQIIPGTALWDIGTLVHEIRRRWNLPLSCPCSEPQTVAAEVTNGQCKDNRDQAIVVSSTGNLSVSSSTSALDFLADVATSQSNDVRRDFQNGDSRVNPSTGIEAPTSAADPTTNVVTGSKVGGEACSTLRELLTKTASRMGVPGGPLDGSSFLSALIPKNNEGSPKQQGKHRTMTSTFEDIIATVVEQHIAEPRSRKQDLSCVRKSPRDEQVEPEMGSKNTLTESSLLYPNVPHSWLCDGKLLLLHEPANKGNFKIFQEQWAKGSPVMVSNVHKQLKSNLWHPKYFSRQFGHIENDLVDCRRGTVIQGAPMKDFWDGFEDLTNRLETKQGLPMILKLKDWPPAEDFAEILPEHFEDMMANLPLPEYTRRDGVLNLSSRLPDFFVKPDLGPKMYNAYGLARYPSAGTTNLHLDISDAVNCMVHVGIPHGGLDDDDQAEALKREAIEAVEYHCKDEQTLRRLREGKENPGALWHIFKQEDTQKIRAFLNVLSQEQGEELLPDHDPIHDQSWYLHDEMLVRLKEEYNVEGWTIVQFMGDAIFIPAGAPHQVQNLHSCIKVAEDFVSPEHIKECICLTDEFRHLSNTHSNHEDKLQVKNILYHAIKEAAGVLMTNDPLLQAAE